MSRPEHPIFGRASESDEADDRAYMLEGQLLRFADQIQTEMDRLDDLLAHDFGQLLPFGCGLDRRPAGRTRPVAASDADADQHRQQGARKSHEGESMSATPEQIAEGLEALLGRFDAMNGDEPVDVLQGELAKFALASRAAASLIRAQSERERVLVDALRSALGWVGHWQRDVDGNLKPTPESLATAYAEIRAALKAAP